MHEEVLRFVGRRRSVRSFTGAPVDRADLEVALQAAMTAPTAMNTRPWQFVVVTDREATRAICRAHPYAAFGEDAGAVILPFGKKEGYPWFDHDMAAATENLLLALANLGLGATWCGMTEKDQGAVRAQVKLPAGFFIFALIPVGVPTEAVPPRMQFEPDRVHWERY